MPFFRVLPLIVASFLSLGAQAGEITVSAASSLGNAMREIAPLFQSANPGTRVQFNLAASGALLAQMTRGAPVDVLVSADQETMDQAQARGLVRAAQRRDIVANTLVLVVPAGSGKMPAALGDLAQPAYTRIAIGLPASVPVGRYTRGALEAAGLWKAIEPKMIGASNVRQALDYVARGEVDAGFVYATDAALMTDRIRVAFGVPTSKPILYPVATVVSAPNPAAAARFVDFLFTPVAQAVFMKHGFSKP